MSRLILLLLVCVLSTTAVAFGQPPPQPVAPPPVPPWVAQPPVLPTTIVVPGAGGPPPPPPAPLGLRAPTQADDLRAPGWFLNLEAGLFVPDVSFNLGAPVRIGGSDRYVALPYAALDWTGAPRIELGYRLPEQQGAFVAGYQAVVSEGSTNLDGYDPAGSGYLKSRLNVNIIDLEYQSPTFELAPLWSLHWEAGLRIGACYFDSRATGQILEQHVSGNYVGAGPLAGLAVARTFEQAPNFAMYGRLDGGLLFGGASQSYEEIITLGNTSVGGATRYTQGQTVPFISLQFGVSVTPSLEHQRTRYLFGYQFEQWYGVGNIANSHADMSFQGFYFRGEFRF